MDDPAFQSDYDDEEEDIEELLENRKFDLFYLCLSKFKNSIFKKKSQFLNRERQRTVKLASFFGVNNSENEIRELRKILENVEDETPSSHDFEQVFFIHILKRKKKKKKKPKNYFFKKKKKKKKIPKILFF